MSNFIWNDTGLNGPKADLVPEPPTANPNQWVNAADWNQIRQALLDVQTVAQSPPTVHDVRNYGAVSAVNGSDPNQALVDCTQAFYNAVAAFHRDPLQPGVGSVYWPEGDWYISSPLQIGAGTTEMYGAGYKQSRIRVGPGTSSSPGLVQGFAGPMVVYAGFDQTGLQYPTYGAPLVGATGQSLNLAPGGLGVGSPMMILTESYPWAQWLYSQASVLTLRMWVKVPTYGQNLGGDILTSAGPLGYLDSSPGPNRQDVAISLSALGTGGGTTIVATLTTYGSGQKTIQSGVVSAGNHHVAMVYDGAHFDLFVDGISQGPVAMTGNIKVTPWEIKAIGGSNANPITGGVDSIELAQVARYTPGVNFTPPTSKHVADANTMWLANWDQGVPTPGQAWSAIAQSRLNTMVPGMVKHYMRSIQWESNGLAEYFTRVHDLDFECNQNTSGIIALNSPWSLTHDVTISFPAGFGYYLPSNTSFFGSVYNIAVDYCAGIGITMAGNGTNLWTRNCQIGQKLNFGDFRVCYDQPYGAFPYASYIPFLLGAGAGDSFSTLFVRNASVDDEGSFINQQTACMVVNGANATMVLENNGWSALGSSPSAPAITYAFVNPSPTEVVHIGDQFYSDQSGVETAHFSYGATNPVKWINCGTPFRGTKPLSNLPEDNLIEQYVQGRHTTQNSISTSGVQGNNLAGEFTISGTATTAHCRFVTPEPDGNFEVVVTYRGSQGAAPAANSWLPAVGGITTFAAGFDFAVQAAPGAGSILIFSYVLVKTPAPPGVRQYFPTVPSTVAYTLPAGPFFAGCTLLPASGHCLVDAESVTPQTVLEDGTRGTANYWNLQLLTGFMPRAQFGTGTNQGINGSFVDANGKLAGLLSPGPHNVVFGLTRFAPGNGINVWTLLVDGSTYYLAANQSAGSQSSPIQIGQHAGGTETLSVATMQDLKVDSQLSKCITNRFDAGPQTGMVESAFMGDAYVVGRAPPTGGGFASQIASTKYGAGTYYYWIAANDFVTAQDLISTNIGIPNAFWGRWGANKSPALNSLVLMVGYSDIVLFGRSAATIFAQISQLVNGVPAQASFFPAGVNTPSKTIYDGPCTGGLGSTSSLTVNGVNFTGHNLGTTPSGNAGQATANDLVSQFNANPGGILSVCTPAASYNATFDQWDLVLTSVATGFGSSSIPVVYDSANGSKGFPPSPTTFVNPAGVNDTITINGHTVDAITLGTQDLTINNIITNINAVPALTAIVTATLDSTTTPHSLKLVANSSGTAGNAITVSVSTAGSSNWQYQGLLVANLQGGVNGAVQVGVSHIVLCTVPPLFPSDYTAPLDAVRNTLNTSIRAFTATGLVIADADVTIRDPANHQNVLPAYLNAGNTGLNVAAHTALVGLINPLIP